MPSDSTLTPEIEAAIDRCLTRPHDRDPATRAALVSAISGALARQRDMTKEALEALSHVENERDEAACALDEFAPHHTGLSLAESVAELRTRLCVVRAEIEAQGGWRDRLAAAESESARLRAEIAEHFHVPGCQSAHIAVANCCQRNDAALNGLRFWHERDEARAESARLREEACRFYRADGSYETLTPEEVVRRRKAAAVDLAALSRAREALRLAEAFMAEEEWSGWRSWDITNDFIGEAHCENCGGFKADGHFEGCTLDAALTAARALSSSPATPEGDKR